MVQYGCIFGSSILIVNSVDNKLNIPSALRGFGDLRLFPLGYRSKSPLGAAGRGANEFPNKSQIRQRERQSARVLKWNSHWSAVRDGSFCFDEDDLAALIKENGDSPIGLGLVLPPGLVVLDFDQLDAAQDRLAEHGVQLPMTLGVGSSRGKHLYFRSSYAGKKRQIKDQDGAVVLELLTGGSGYVVLPPSIHPHGLAYQWLNPDAEIAELPAEIYSLFGIDLDAPSGTGGAPVPLAPRIEQANGADLDGALQEIEKRAQERGCEPDYECGELVMLCPCEDHDETVPSARFRIKDDRLLGHCFGCDANGSRLVAALGLPASRLFGVWSVEPAILSASTSEQTLEGLRITADPKELGLRGSRARALVEVFLPLLERRVRGGNLSCVPMTSSYLAHGLGCTDRNSRRIIADLEDQNTLVRGTPLPSPRKPRLIPSNTFSVAVERRDDTLFVVSYEPDDAADQPVRRPDGGSSGT